MSILITGMEMPTSCGQCRFFAWSRGVGQHCAVASDITFHATIDGMDVAYERNGECPLVPVPPHGKLIDADALIIDLMDRGMEGVQTNDLHEIQQAVMDAPTIVPASDKEAKE